MKKGIELQCQRTACRHRWIYRGKNKFVCTCPKCHTTVSIRKQTK